jgi:hypothetical protein
MPSQQPSEPTGLKILGAIGDIADIGAFLIDILDLILPLAVPKPGPQSTVRIAVGLHNTDDLGGNVPGVQLWNENGEPLGSAGVSNDKFGSGTFTDIVVNQKSNQQPTNLQIQGGSDSICIAYIGHTWPDGTKRGWLGDMGRYCDKQWYYSSVYVTQSNGSAYTVRIRYVKLS